jgi:hypothetical protein
MTDAELDRLFRQKYDRRGERRAAAGVVRGRPPKFTPEQAKALIEARAAGRGIMELAREHRTTQSVIAKYVRCGFKPKRWAA